MKKFLCVIILIAALFSFTNNTTWAQDDPSDDPPGVISCEDAYKNLEYARDNEKNLDTKSTMSLNLGKIAYHPAPKEMIDKLEQTTNWPKKREATAYFRINLNRDALKSLIPIIKYKPTTSDNNSLADIQNSQIDALIILNSTLFKFKEKNFFEIIMNATDLLKNDNYQIRMQAANVLGTFCYQTHKIRSNKE